MSYINDPHAEQVHSLFKDAHEKLEKIDNEAKEKKKDVVVKLAKNLEDKIPKDTICKTIIYRLGSIVDDRFIRQCLPEDYKQKRYSENAKKQKIRPKIQQNLAVLTPLNQEDEEEKQEVVVIGTEGMTYTQREGGAKPSKSFNDPSISKDKVSNQKTMIQEGQEQQQQQKEEHSEKPNEFEISGENRNVSIEMMDTSTSSETSSDSNKDVLPFEFSLSREDVQRHLDSVEVNTDDDNDNVRFNGTIDVNTGVVISVKIGRQRQKVQ